MCPIRQRAYRACSVNDDLRRRIDDRHGLRVGNDDDFDRWRRGRGLRGMVVRRMPIGREDPSDALRGSVPGRTQVGSEEGEDGEVGF